MLSFSNFRLLSLRRFRLCFFTLLNIVEVLLLLSLLTVRAILDGLRDDLGLLFGSLSRSLRCGCVFH